MKPQLLGTALIESMSGGGVLRRIFRLRVQARLQGLRLGEVGPQLFRRGNARRILGRL